MPTQTGVDSENKTVGDLFKDFYVVPDFQREFVWGEKEVEELLQDVYTEWASGPPSGTGDTSQSEYFLGSIVVRTIDDDLYELIDGQQRMTTIYLFFCALRDFLENKSSSPIDVLPGFIASAGLSATGHNEYRYRVELQYEDSAGVLTAVASGDGDLGEISRDTKSIENVLNAYTVIRTFLESEFREESDARSFFAYLTKRVKLVRVSTGDLARALKVFETLNQRGVGLNSMDLLKNLLFQHVSQDAFEVLKEHWKELIDTLFGANEKPLRFLRYYIFATYSVERLKEDEIYGWFKDNAEIAGYKENPLGFVDELIRGAKAYVQFSQGRDSNGVVNRYLENIRLMSGAARQHLVLLLAGEHLPHDNFKRLAQELENLFFAFLISGERTNEFEKSFAQWAPALREVTDEASLDEFIQAKFLPAKRNVAARFSLAFRELDQTKLQKYRLRYVLGKLTQYVNEHAYGSDGAAAELKTFINRQVDVEHILPQDPTDETVEAFDKAEEIEAFIRSLGNLCFLEQPYNGSVGRKAFEEKKPLYAQSQFLLTKILGGPVESGANTSVTRSLAGLSSFNSWDSAAIIERQEQLRKLATKVWEMPDIVEEDSPGAPG